jgi:hypothetical protein
MNVAIPYLLDLIGGSVICRMSRAPDKIGEDKQKAEPVNHE